MKLRNKSKDTIILTGYHMHTAEVVEPGAVADLDPERLMKLYPGDPVLDKLEPADLPKAEAPKLAPKPEPGPSDEEAEAAKLRALLQEK